MMVAHEEPRGRVVVLDSLTHCDERITPADVVVAGSFAGPLAFAFALERGVRAIVAHGAGVGLEGAGIAGLAVADRFAVPAGLLSRYPGCLPRVRSHAGRNPRVGAGRQRATPGNLRPGPCPPGTFSPLTGWSCLFALLC